MARPPAASAQVPPPAGGWEAVEAVPAGSRLAVKLRDGRSVKGTFDSATDATLTLSGKDGVLSLNRADILTVHRASPKSGRKSALVGAGLGAAAGVAAGAAVRGNNATKSAGIVPVIAGVAAGVGALFGSLFGGGQERVLIYEAR